MGSLVILLPIKITSKQLHTNCDGDITHVHRRMSMLGIQCVADMVLYIMQEHTRINAHLIGNDWSIVVRGL
jgi:hypothetical protein